MKHMKNMVPETCAQVFVDIWSINLLLLQTIEDTSWSCSLIIISAQNGTNELTVYLHFSIIY